MIRKFTTFGLLATFATAALSPMALADSKQNNKNLGRNIGIGGGAVMVHGLLRHNTTETVLGAAGAAAGAKMYEDNRKAQSREKRERQRAYHRRHRVYHRYHRVR